MVQPMGEWIMWLFILNQLMFLQVEVLMVNPSGCDCNRMLCVVLATVLQWHHVGTAALVVNLPGMAGHQWQKLL